MIEMKITRNNKLVAVCGFQDDLPKECIMSEVGDIIDMIENDEDFGQDTLPAALAEAMIDIPRKYF